jgi:hypothetical protein
MLLKQLLLLLLMLLMLHQLPLLYCVERTHKTILQQSFFIWTFFNTFVMAGQLHSEEHIRAMWHAAESMGIPPPPAAIFPGPEVAHVAAPAPAQQQQQQQVYYGALAAQQFWPAPSYAPRMAIFPSATMVPVAPVADLGAMPATGIPFDQHPTVIASGTFSFLRHHPCQRTRLVETFR